MILKYSVGLDVSGKDIKAAICTIDNLQDVKVKSSLTIANTKKGFAKLEDWIKRFHKDKSLPVSMCLEATGVYHENCALYFHLKEYRISIVLPNKAKKYLSALGLKSKNDKIDAKGLSFMNAQQNLKPWQPMKGFYYRLRSLTRQYQSLTEQRTAALNQLHAEEVSMITDKFIVRQLKSKIKFIEKQKKQIEKAIEDHVKSDQEISKKVDNICQIKGLALLSVSTILAETNGFELFTNYKQLVSYAGYDVVENQSGNREGRTKISKKGNSRIRRILHMPAFGAVRHKEPKLLSLYERTYARHGRKMKSYVAVQKKLLLMIYYLFKYDKSYQSSNKVNIQEKEQESSFGLQTSENQSSPNKVKATLGKHSVSDHSMSPLGKTKIKKNEKILVF
jgi:transposase